MNGVFMEKEFNGSTYFIASQINQYLHNNSLTKNLKKYITKLSNPFHLSLVSADEREKVVSSSDAHFLF